MLLLDKEWIKCGIGNSLYIRPFVIATQTEVSASPSNEYKFLQQFNLDKDDHFLVDSGDNKIQIVDNNVAILESTETGSFYRIDIEDTDSFFISSSQNAFIVHNAPCFVAGTKIHTENGIKNIEDVKVVPPRLFELLVLIKDAEVVSPSVVVLPVTSMPVAVVASLGALS